MELFFTGFLLSLSLCLDLGVVNVALLRKGIRHGAWAAFALGLGSCVGDLVYALAAVWGVTALLSFTPIRWFLWLGGSAVLMFLTIKMLWECYRPRDFQELFSETKSSAGLSRSALEGMVLAMASPSAIIWHATVGGAVISNTAEENFAAVWILLSGYLAAGVVWSLFLSLASSQGRRLGPRFMQGISLFSALIFAILAIKVFLDGYHQLIRVNQS